MVSNKDNNGDCSGIMIVTARPGKRLQKTMEDPPFLMGKLTVNSIYSLVMTNGLLLNMAINMS